MALACFDAGKPQASSKIRVVAKAIAPSTWVVLDARLGLGSVAEHTSKGAYKGAYRKKRSLTQARWGWPVAEFGVFPNPDNEQVSGFDVLEAAETAQAYFDVLREKGQQGNGASAAEWGTIDEWPQEPANTNIIPKPELEKEPLARVPLQQNAFALSPVDQGVSAPFVSPLRKRQVWAFLIGLILGVWAMIYITAQLTGFDRGSAPVLPH